MQSTGDTTVHPESHRISRDRERDNDMDAAKRVFAAEFNTSTCSSELPDTPRYMSLLTPTGARCTRLFIVGACTEVRSLQGSYLSARVADPGGVFMVVSGRENPDICSAMRELIPPEFVAVCGDIQSNRYGTPEPFIIRPETLVSVDRRIRDMWVLRTAELTIGRMERMREVMNGHLHDTDAEDALMHYGQSEATMTELARTVDLALQSVKPVLPGSMETVCDPRSMILETIRTQGSSRGMSVEDLYAFARKRGLKERMVRDILAGLLQDGECYAPSGGYIKFL